jgi:hypothetical protein
MESADDYKIDSRWSEYKNRFNTLPNYYFHCLTYPNSPAHAAQLLDALDLEIDSITSQFKERMVELQSSHSEEKLTEYNIWHLKAQRAQRMKEAQIRVLQAWLAENTTDINTRVDNLEEKVVKLQEALELLLEILQNKAQN